MPNDLELVRRLGAAGRAFFGRFDTLRDVQREALEPIFSGASVLVSSPTASGKTEAVIAPIVARITGNRPSRERGPFLLAVAPTRALVNDLHARLSRPLEEIGWSCGRQTSDHKDKGRCPDLLITTPESFDSMLVRDSRTDQGRLVGHLLASVQGVFVDEAHLFEASPRGAQVVWLLGRLRRLRAHALSVGWTVSSGLQVCAASATVAKPEELAMRLLGQVAVSIRVPGSREMEMLSRVPGRGWVPLETLSDPEQIHSELCFARGTEDIMGVVQSVWSAIERGSESGCRKALVFVPSRTLCDQLSLALSDVLKSRRDIYVGAHHGSLDRGMREQAERKFSTSRDAVLVATTTLEVGIDIGDVDVVVLVGAPPDTSSLLQRIGRAGRRSGIVRVVGIPRTVMEGRALASMLDASCRHSLDPVPQARLWSVYVQQVASHTAQAQRRGRRRADLVDLAQSVWPEATEAKTASSIVDTLLQDELLVAAGDRLFLGSEWSDRFEDGGGLHSNFSSPLGIPVVDASTGEVIARVSQSPDPGATVAMAGRRWNLVSESGEIVVSGAREPNGDVPASYAPKRGPMGRSYAEHVRRGLGLATEAAPVLTGPWGEYWFHFGGAAFEAILRALIPSLEGDRSLSGIALRGVPRTDVLAEFSQDETMLSEVIERLATEGEMPMSLGLYHNLLPPEVKSAVCREFLEPEVFAVWLRSRDLRSAGIDRVTEGRIRQLAGWSDT